jgi:hypothetical protein
VSDEQRRDARGTHPPPQKSDASRMIHPLRYITASGGAEISKRL